MKEISIITVLFAGLILFSCDSTISESQAETFLKMYGSKGIDDAKGIALLSSGGYALCGTETTDAGTKMILIVTDEYGNIQEGFPKYYPEGDLNAGANAIVAKNGGNNGFLLSGYIEDARGDKDIYVVKTSPDGTVNWSNSYGSVEDEEALHATEGIGYEFLLSGYQEKSGEKDVMIMALDQAGDSIPLSLWYTKPDESKDAAANFILNVGDHYLCVATYNKYIGEGTDILVLNFDDDLSPNDKVIDGLYNEFGKCIVQIAESEFVVLGNRDNEATQNSEILLYHVKTNGLLVKDYELLATISESGADLIAERLVKTAEGKYAIIGTRTLDGEADIFVQFLEGGQEGIRKTYGLSGNQSGADLGGLEGGGLVILGENEYEGNSMISLIKTNESGNY